MTAETQYTSDPNEVKSKFPEPILVKQNYDVEPEDIKFHPPLYRQRYGLGVDYVKKVSAVKIVDFGCAECKFIWTLRNLGFGHVREIIGVDIDKFVLERHSQVAKPVTSEYLIRRTTPLRIGLYCGSLTQWDPRLAGADFVSLIEVIEHLKEDTLSRLPAAVFGQLRPKHVLVTTPNSEFNVLFKQLTGFRHPDHKFEWRRDEFMTWCEAVCHSFPYQVEFCGVGEPPMGLEEVGYCSQAAFFSIKPELGIANLEITSKPKMETESPLKVNGTEISEESPENTPRESIFSSIEIPQPILNPPKLEPSDTSKSEPTETTEPADSNPEEKFPYEEIICIDFPIEDPSITPVHKLLAEIDYYATQIARMEWKKLSEQQDVREEDLKEHPVQSDWVYFEIGPRPCVINAFISIANRLMTYPQINTFGDFEYVLNTVICSPDANINSELTHYKVELTIEDSAYYPDSEGDTNWNQDQVEWSEVLQENIQEKSFVSVPENWDEETWDNT